MGHVTGESRYQVTLFPEVLDEVVGRNDAVRVIDAFVDSLDLAELGFSRVAAEEMGRPPYAPGDLLKLYIYGYLHRIRASRRLEAETHRNVQVMWLIQRLTTGFKTIAYFRKDHAGAIVEVCRAFIRFCREQSLFGAEFLSILDSYRYVERAIKYGVLFLVLVFTTFFLFEVTARQKIHPFQYLMVGAALCLFYLLLLSISEFVGFGWGYLIAAVASTLLITWYCRFFLGGGVRTLMIGAGLAGVYTFLYITLRQQDYALLMGAIALFIVLAIVMYVTRKVDWYARDAG